VGLKERESGGCDRWPAGTVEPRWLLARESKARLPRKLSIVLALQRITRGSHPSVAGGHPRYGRVWDVKQAGDLRDGPGAVGQQVRAWRSCSGVSERGRPPGGRVLWRRRGPHINF
jgi:hypothetical protein